MEAVSGQHFAKSFLEDTTVDERRDRYRRLRDENLGSIELRGVVGAEDGSIRVLFGSAKGQMAESLFELSGDAPQTIAGIRVALVQVDAD